MWPHWGYNLKGWCQCFCSANLASFPGPAQLSVAYNTVLQATGSWARAWERGYSKPTKIDVVILYGTNCLLLYREMIHMLKSVAILVGLELPLMMIAVAVTVIMRMSLLPDRMSTVAALDSKQCKCYLATLSFPLPTSLLDLSALIGK